MSVTCQIYCVSGSVDIINLKEALLSKKNLHLKFFLVMHNDINNHGLFKLEIEDFRSYHFTEIHLVCSP